MRGRVRFVPKADKVQRNKNGLTFDHIVGGYQPYLSVELCKLKIHNSQTITPLRQLAG
jgi:hypothetical protein